MRKLALLVMGLFLIFMAPTQEAYAGEIQYIPDIERSVDINEDVISFETTTVFNIPIEVKQELVSYNYIVPKEESKPLITLFGEDINAPPIDNEIIKVSYSYLGNTGLKMDYSQLGYSLAQ